MAEDAVVQRLDIVGDTFAQRKVAKVLKIGPGLVHDGDDIGAGILRNGSCVVADL